MPWMWVIATAAFVLGVNLGLVVMGVLVAGRRD